MSNHPWDARAGVRKLSLWLIQPTKQHRYCLPRCQLLLFRELVSVGRGPADGRCRQGNLDGLALWPVTPACTVCGPTFCFKEITSRHSQQWQLALLGQGLGEGTRGAVGIRTRDLGGEWWGWELGSGWRGGDGGRGISLTSGRWGSLSISTSTSSRSSGKSSLPGNSGWLSWDRPAQSFSAWRSRVELLAQRHVVAHWRNRA